MLVGLIQSKGLQNEEVNSLYRVLVNPIPKNVMVNKNKAKSWDYGYDSKYDIIVISRTGKIGDIVSISGLKIALPPSPVKCLQRHKTKLGYFPL